VMQIWGNDVVSWGNVFHAILVYVSTILLQLFVTGFLLWNGQVMEEGVNDNYYVEHFNVTLRQVGDYLARAVELGDPHLLPKTLESAGGVFSKCAVQMNVGIIQIYYIMIFFWMSYMLIEFKSAAWWLVYLIGVKDEFIHTEYEEMLSTGSRFELPSPCLFTPRSIGNKTGNLVEWHEKKKQFIIVRLTMPLRVLLILLHPVVKLWVAMAITYAGAKFLILQVDAVKIVMKVLCMRFVIQIDELMLMSTSTKHCQELVKGARLRTDWGHPGKASVWERGFGGFVYLLIGISSLIFTLHWTFGDLMHFRLGCFGYHSQFRIPGVEGVIDMRSLVGQLVQVR